MLEPLRFDAGVRFMLGRRRGRHWPIATWFGLFTLDQSAGSAAILRASSRISSIRATSSRISLLETIPRN